MNPIVDRLSIFSFSFRSLYPDDVSPESLERRVSEMEEKLLKALDLEKITIVKKETPHVEPAPNVEIPVKQSPTVKKSAIVKNKITPQPEELTPQCVSIPDMWNLKNITIKTESNARNLNKNNSLTSETEADWEFI
jgi:hypothetical protein